MLLSMGNADMKTNDGRIELSANNTSSANGANYDNIRVYETNSNVAAEMVNNVITVVCIKTPLKYGLL